LKFKKAELLEKSYAMSGYFTFGYTSLVISSLLPLIERNFSLLHSQVGIMLSVGSISFLITSLVIGYLLEKFDTFRITTGGLLAATFGGTMFIISRGFPELLIAITLTNIGAATVEVSVPFVIGLNEEDGKKGEILNIVHSLFAFGAISGPFITSLIIKNPSNWKYSFLTVIAFSLIPMISITLAKDHVRAMFKNYKANKSGKRGNTLREALELLKNKFFILLILGLAIYVGYEMSFSSWLSIFLFEYRGFKVDSAALYPSFLWIGLFLGRLIFAKAADKIGYKKWLIITSVSSAITTVLAIVISKNTVSIFISVLLTGLAYATIYPVIQAIIIDTFRKNKGTALGITAASTSILSALTNFTIGQIGNAFGIFAGLLTVVVLTVLEIVVVSYYKTD